MIKEGKQLELTLKGSVPSKKNSKRVFCRGGKPVVLPSKNYEEWHEEQMWLLKGTEAPKSVEKVHLTIYPPTRHKSDLTNKAESVMDLLVDAGVLEDDNWFVVPDLHLKFGGVDRDEPRVEITIISKENDKDE